MRLTEFHLVHSLSSIPMQESFPPEHDNKLVTDTLEHFLNAGRVSDKGGAHLQSSGGDGAESGLDIIRNPLNEVARALGLDVTHLILDLLHGDLSAAIICCQYLCRSNNDRKVLFTRRWRRSGNDRYGNREQPSCS